MPSTFPQELFDRFVDELVSPDADISKDPSIRSCLFVSPLRHRALTLIFKKVTVHLNHPQETCKRLLNLLRIIPPCPRTKISGVGPYIKEIAFEFALYGTSSGARKALQHIISSREFKNLVKTLNGRDYGVRGLEFHIRVYFSIRTSYHPGPDILKALSSLIASPFLRSLALTNLAKVPATFLAEAHIDELHLWDVYFQDSDPLRGSSRHVAALARWPQIRSLRGNSSLPKALISPASTAPFRNLEVIERECLGVEQASEAWKIIYMAAHTLVHVSLEGREELSLCDGQRVDLGRVPNLASFQLAFLPRMTMQVDPDAGRKSVALFIAILHAPSPLLKLETLTLTGWMSGGPRAPGIPANVGGIDNILTESKPEWEMLDTLLSGPKYPSLRFLKLRFIFHVFLYARLMTSSLATDGRYSYLWATDADREEFTDMITSRVPVLLPRIQSSRRIQLVVEVVDSFVWRNSFFL